VSALLDDIINLAIDGTQPLPDILRKCLLLGHELKNQKLKDWANQELNGYDSGREVPEYRIKDALARGNFIGPGNAQYHRHLIPSLVLEENHRDFAEKVYLTQSVTAYAENLKQLDESGNFLLTFNWDPNMVGYYQDKLLQGGFLCHAAWQEVPISVIAEMLDSVRNRTLNMALQIKDELGTSYDDLRRIQPQEAKKVDSIIIQTTGGNTNVAFGQGAIDASGQGQKIIAVGDRQALDRVLSSAGLDKSDLDSLTEAIQADGKKPGNKISEWAKEKGSKVLSGGIQVGTKIGSEILTAWIKQHYGL
jgi:hypothetical protein